MRLIGKPRAELERVAAVRGVLGGSRPLRIEYHEREGTLAIPDAAAAVEHHLRLAARTCAIGLDVAGCIAHEARERRIVSGFAAAGGAHQHLAHGLLQSRGRLSLDVDLVGAHGPSRLARQRTTQQHEQEQRSQVAGRGV